jgi:hypothetical protein
MPERDPNLIWIQDAATEYQRSRKWLDGQVALGKLSYATIEGDKRQYLLRSELDTLLLPQIKRRDEDAG